MKHLGKSWPGNLKLVNQNKCKFLKAIQIFLFVYHMSPEGKFWSSLAHTLTLGMCNLSEFPGSFSARSSGVRVLEKLWQAFAFCSDDTESFSSLLQVQSVNNCLYHKIHFLVVLLLFRQSINGSSKSAL